MSILQGLLILSALTSLLVTGPNLAPDQANAEAFDDRDNNKIPKDVGPNSGSANQQLDQDNLCYNDDGCEQANEGQEIEGKDNEASGFSDQSKNVQQQQASLSTTPSPQTPGNGTTPASTPSTLTVNKIVTCNFASTAADCPTADEFNFTVTTNNGSSYTFSGSEGGTPLTINPPFPVTYHVKETNAPPGFVVDTIPVGLQPIGIAFNPDNGYLYVVNDNDDTVSVIDGTTNTVIDTIPVGSAPYGIAYNSDNGDLYVTNGGGNTISVIDGTTNTVIDTIPVGQGLQGIAFNPGNGNLYAANIISNTVSVIDSQTNTVIDTIPVGINPVGVAFNAANGHIYVTNESSNTVSIIDSQTNTVIDTIPVGSFPISISVDFIRNMIYVPNSDSTIPSTVSVIDGTTNTVIDTIPVGQGPVGVAFNPGNGNLYVTNINSNTVSVIDSQTNTVIDTIPVGSRPYGIAYNSANNDVYVSNSDSTIPGTVSVIDVSPKYSGGCNGTIDGAGQTAVCDITNTIGRPA